MLVRRCLAPCLALLALATSLSAETPKLAESLGKVSAAEGLLWAGLAAGALVSFLTFKGLLRIPMRHFFRVTNWLITLLAAGMAAQSVSYLEKAGVITRLGETVWDTSWLLSENSMPGRVLHVLVGYADAPTAAQLVAYVAVVAGIWFAAKLANPPHGAEAAALKRRPAA